MTAVGAIQGYLAELQATMSGLPAALEAAAPTGSFASVLDSALSVLEGAGGGPAGTVTTTAAPTSPPLGPTLSSVPSALATTTGSTGSVTGAEVAAEAERFLGVPYLWGGTTPAGFDCSGLVQYVYGQLGIPLPRTSEEQALVGTPVPSLAQAQPGDLVFYPGSDGTPSAPGHVGIYLGNGQMLDAPYTGASVRIDPVGTPVAIRRILPASSSANAPVGAGTFAPTANAAVPSSLASTFLAAAGRYGVPVSLLTAVAKVESGFTPTAVSSAGAQGLMQLMPQTAASLGIDPFDPAQAIDGAARLLSGYLQHFGSIPAALAAYNAGPAAVASYGGVPPYPQTQAYVQSVLQAMGATAGGVA